MLQKYIWMGCYSQVYSCVVYLRYDTRLKQRTSLDKYIYHYQLYVYVNVELITEVMMWNELEASGLYRLIWRRRRINWHKLIIDSYTLQCRHNERDGVSNHKRPDSLLNRLFRLRSKKASKLHLMTSSCIELWRQHEMGDIIKILKQKAQWHAENSTNWSFCEQSLTLCKRYTCTRKAQIHKT